MPDRRLARKGSVSDSALLTPALLLFVALMILVIINIGGSFLGIFGRDSTAATSIDKGFANLITKIGVLEGSAPDTLVDHAFTVDNGFYVVSFNKGETRTGTAIKPPECEGATCLCVCIDEKCEKIDASRGRGRDCRPLYQFSAVIAQFGIKNNMGDEQADGRKEYVVSPDGFRQIGYYFFVSGSKKSEDSTVAVTLHKGNGNLYLRKPI